ncbi:hypothetical protein ScPMuIL_016118 [Solemya velum]
MEGKWSLILFYLITVDLSSQEPGCGSFSHYDLISDEICLLLPPEKETWDNAQARCESEGGFLATVFNEMVGIIIEGHILTSRGKHSHFWLGGTNRNAADGTWNWIEPGIIYSVANTGYDNWGNKYPRSDATFTLHRNQALKDKQAAQKPLNYST